MKFAFFALGLASFIAGAALATTLPKTAAATSASMAGMEAMTVADDSDKKPDAPQAAGTVAIHNFKFNPPAITVHAGQSVTWINQDESPHTVADTDKSYRSAALDTGDKYSHTFKIAGTFHYFCTMHPQMMGEVDVVP